MKTKSLILLLLIALFTSCSNDDDSGKSQSELIIGKWGYSSYVFDGNDSTPPESGSAESSCGYWATETFTDSGTSIYQSLNQNCDEMGSPESTPYSVDGGYLIYHTSDEGDVVWKIEELTGSKLVIESNGEHLRYNKL